jgi:hypothetical protein
MNRSTFVTAVHGNEQLPVLALASVGEKQIVANPEALRRNVRFLEKDLNASFGTDGESLEERRARKILARLSKAFPVIDFHSTTGVTPPFAIVVDMAMIPLAQSLGLNHVVVMKYNIKGGYALINHCDGVSVEVGQHGDPASFDTTLKILKACKEGKRNKNAPVYEVYSKIEKPGVYKNFQAYKEGDETFYPVLAGENSYGFPGLKARLLEPKEYARIKTQQESV